MTSIINIGLHGSIILNSGTFICSNFNLQYNNYTQLGPILKLFLQLKFKSTHQKNPQIFGRETFKEHFSHVCYKWFNRWY